MPVVIRLARQGKRHHPFYRITVADSRAASTGRFLEQIGYYDPNNNPPILKIEDASAIDWLRKGAQPSDTVKSLFSRAGIMEKHAAVKNGKATLETPVAPKQWKTKKPKVHKKARAAAAKAG